MATQKGARKRSRESKGSQSPITVRQDPGKPETQPPPAAPIGSTGIEVPLTVLKSPAAAALPIPETPPASAVAAVSSDLTNLQRRAAELIARRKPLAMCACGCGTSTRATWAPGHNGRALGRLLAEARQGAVPVC